MSAKKADGRAQNRKKRQKTAKKNVFFWIFGKSTNGITNLILKHHHKCGGTSFNPYIMLKTHFIQNLEGGHENRYLAYLRHFHCFYIDESNISVQR